MSGTARKLCLLTIQGVYLFCSNEDDELERRRRIEAVRLEEEKKRKEEEYQREREKWRKKKEECSKRASKFADLKRRRVEERKKQEEAKKILETEDMWEELGHYFHASFRYLLPNKIQTKLSAKMRQPSQI